MKFALFLLLAIVVGGLIYIRFAPSHSDRWHIDPVLAKDPGKGGILIAPGVITSALSPEALLGEFDDVVRAEPGVKILAGSLAEGHITYILRSKLMGFPDFLTVQALPHETGSTLAVLSRLRFGQSDIGVNKRRLQRLLDRMQDGVLITR